MPKKTEMEKIKKAIADYIQENGVTSTRDVEVPDILIDNISVR